jgi:hypothetical protein
MPDNNYSLSSGIFSRKGGMWVAVHIAQENDGTASFTQMLFAAAAFPNPVFLLVSLLKFPGCRCLAGEHQRCGD